MNEQDVIEFLTAFVAHHTQRRDHIEQQLAANDLDERTQDDLWYEAEARDDLIDAAHILIDALENPL